MANKNTIRKKQAARDAYGRVKMAEAKKRLPAPADIAQAESVGRKARRYKNAKVGASGPLIARRLGHHLNPTHQGPR